MEAVYSFCNAVFMTISQDTAVAYLKRGLALLERGGQARLADALGIPSSRISEMKKDGRKITLEEMAGIERFLMAHIEDMPPYFANQAISRDERALLMVYRDLGADMKARIRDDAAFFQALQKTEDESPEHPLARNAI